MRLLLLGALLLASVEDVGILLVVFAKRGRQVLGQFRRAIAGVALHQDQPIAGIRADRVLRGIRARNQREENNQCLQAIAHRTASQPDRAIPGRRELVQRPLRTQRGSLSGRDGGDAVLAQVQKLVELSAVEGRPLAGALHFHKLA